MRTVTIAAASAAIFMFPSPTLAQQRGQLGTADEAKAMLLKAVAAVKADKARAASARRMRGSAAGQAGGQALADGKAPKCSLVNRFRAAPERDDHSRDRARDAL